MNILQMQDQMRGLPDSALQAAAGQPGAHQFLAYAEMAERERIRGAYAKQQQAAAPTVAQRLMAGGDVPEVSSPRMDIGALAAASNRGEMQPAIGMAQGGAVPERPGSLAVVQGRRPVPGEPPAQKPLPDDNLAAMILGLGRYADSRGYAGLLRGPVTEAGDEFMQNVRGAAPQDRVAPMLAAMEADRARQAQMASRDRWMALAQAGLGMAGGNSPNFLTNLVSGAQTGVAALQGARTQAEQRNAAMQSRADLLERTRMEQEGANARAMQGALATRYGGDMQAQGRVDNAVFESLGIDVGARNAAALQAARLAKEAQMQKDRLAASLEETKTREEGQTRRTQMTLAEQRITAQANQNIQSAQLAAQKAASAATTDLEKRRIAVNATANIDQNIAAMAEAGAFGPPGTPEAAREMARASDERRASLYRELGLPYETDWLSSVRKSLEPRPRSGPDTGANRQ